MSMFDISMAQRVKVQKAKLVIIGAIFVYLLVHHWLTGAPIFQ